MATRVQLWGFDDEGEPAMKAVYFLKNDGTVGIDAPTEAGKRYALRLVQDGIKTIGGNFTLRDGQKFLDNLHNHFHGRYTWVKDEEGS